MHNAMHFKVIFFILLINYPPTNHIQALDALKFILEQVKTLHHFLIPVFLWVKLIKWEIQDVCADYQWQYQATAPPSVDVKCIVTTSPCDNQPNPIILTENTKLNQSMDQK